RVEQRTTIRAPRFRVSTVGPTPPSTSPTPRPTSVVPTPPVSRTTPARPTTGRPTRARPPTPPWVDEPIRLRIDREALRGLPSRPGVPPHASSGSDTAAGVGANHRLEDAAGGDVRQGVSHVHHPNLRIHCSIRKPGAVDLPLHRGGGSARSS